MKKLFMMALIAFAAGITVLPVEAKTGSAGNISATANALDPQVRIRVGGNRRNRRVYRTTRISPNGRRIVTRTTRISPNGRRVVVRRRVIRRPYRRY